MVAEPALSNHSDQQGPGTQELVCHSRLSGRIHRSRLGRSHRSARSHLPHRRIGNRPCRQDLPTLQCPRVHLYPRRRPHPQQQRGW
jgi:hypothetical protein